MLNFVKAEPGSSEMIEATNKAMSIIDLYPDVFPHLNRQGFKLEKYFQNGTAIIQDGVLITFCKYKSKGKISKNAKTHKKRGDFMIYQLASNGSIEDGEKSVLNHFIEYCKSQRAENIFIAIGEKNTNIIDFYLDNGFVIDSKIHWGNEKNGIINGLMFRLRLTADKNIETIIF